MSNNIHTDAVINRALACDKQYAQSQNPSLEYYSNIAELEFEGLIRLYPDALSDANAKVLLATYAKLTCGEFLRDEQEFNETMAQLQALKLKLESNVTEADGYLPTTHRIIAAGVYEWPDTSATNSISVVGLESTDVVIASLAVANTTNTLQTALNDYANDQIDLTLSAAGTTDVRVAYQVLRPV